MLTVVDLDAAGRLAAREEWAGLPSISSDDLMALDTHFCQSCLEWKAIQQAGKTLAIFEIRTYPANFIKNMHVMFAPDFDLDLEGMDPATADDEVERLIATLAAIFEYFVSRLDGQGTRCIKIRNDHQPVLVIFFEFAKYLATTYSESYKIKYYGKWIELHSNGK